MEEQTMPEVDLLATAKAVQKGRIKNSFDRAPQSGCETSGGFVMDSTREDIDNLTRLYNRTMELGDTSTTVTVRDKSNKFHTLTIGDLKTLIDELVDFGLGLFAKKWALEQSIEEAETVEGVEAITW